MEINKKGHQQMNFTADISIERLYNAYFLANLPLFISSLSSSMPFTPNVHSLYDGRAAEKKSR